MKNRLKGVTLIETMLYIGLFSVIIIIVLNFMLSTQEATLRNSRKNDVHQSYEFITQHINYSFNKALSIVEGGSSFGNNQGILQLQFSDGNMQYYVTDNTLFFDGIPITPESITVNSFSLEQVFDRDNIMIGVRFSIQLTSKGDSSITDTLNMLSTLR